MPEEKTTPFASPLGDGKKEPAKDATAEKPAGKEAGGDVTARMQDVPLTLQVEVGRTTMKVKDFLALGAGSIVALEKPVDEPLKINVNGIVFAEGEVVVIEDNFAIRILKIRTGENE